MDYKTILKRVVCAALSVIILLGAVGCGKDEETKKKKKVVVKKVITVIEDENGATEEDGQNSNAGDTPEYVRRRLAEIEQGEYVETFTPEYKTSIADYAITGDIQIVYSDDVLYAFTNAIHLRNFIAKNTGTVLEVVEDSKAKSASKQILVGNTIFHRASLKSNEYAVYLAGQKLVFVGGHAAMVECAVDWFMAEKWTTGKVTLLVGKVDTFTPTVTTANGVYEYTWGDDFSGTHFDDVKWLTGHMTNTESVKNADFGTKYFDISDGRLKLGQDRYFSDEYPQYEYVNATGVCTGDRMGYLFGYAELRARVPYGRGSWPAWWINGVHALGPRNPNALYFGEVDMFEIFASHNTVTPNIHKFYYNAVGGRTHTQYNEGGRSSGRYRFENYTNLCYEYHTYSLEWTPNQLLFKVDGETYWDYDLNKNYDGLDSMDVFKTDPMEMAINLILCTTDNTNVFNDNMYVNNPELPYFYYIDYIRIYQCKDIKGTQMYVKDAAGGTQTLF